MEVVVHEVKEEGLVVAEEAVVLHVDPDSGLELL
jgi:hypothetical protein